jgi:two-component system, LytTR family, response regulator
MLSTIIVDDELAHCESLSGLLQKHCADVQVDACCHSGTEAYKSIKQLKPSLVFLEIKMPGMNGFELLEKLSPIHFDVIVVSADNDYAIKAFQYDVVAYLLKPVDKTQLVRAVQKVKMHMEERIHEQIAELIQKVDRLNYHGQIALPTFEGLQMVNVDNIISCASDSNYTKVHVKKGQKLVVSKTLGDVEELLREYSFIRVHNSHLVNINEINKYVKIDGGHLVMSDGSIIDVSRHKRDLLIKKLTKL